VKLLDVTEEVISEDSDNGLEQGKTGSIESITISQHVLTLSNHILLNVSF
jgi:hypothetical protein